MKVILTPENFNRNKILRLPQEAPKVFLGGSIEMGKADNWQQKATDILDECVIFNPRRVDWDSSWKQDPIVGSEFYNQVSWELDCQDTSTFIIYNFDPATQSPITLLELGVYAAKGKRLFVCCPKEYFRYGNVRIVSERYDNIKFFHDFDNMINAVSIAVDSFNYQNSAKFDMEFVNEETSSSV